MPFKISCWNIQTITLARASTHAKTIARHISGITNEGTDPFILLILENETKPLDVMNALKVELDKELETVIQCSVTGMGRAGKGNDEYSTENLLIMRSEGVGMLPPLQFKGWRTEFNRTYEKIYTDTGRDARAKERGVRRDRPPRRAATIQGYGAAKKGKREAPSMYSKPKTLATTRQEYLLKYQPKSAAQLRDPILVQFSYGSFGPISIIALHAPGPKHSAASIRNQPYSAHYATTMLRAASSLGAGFVMRDFNVYGGLETFRYETRDRLPTTRSGKSCLDNVFMGKRVSSSVISTPGMNEGKPISGLVGDTSSKGSPPAVSDHSAIVASLGP